MSDDLRDLYQEVILQHGRSPKNFRAIDDADAGRLVGHAYTLRNVPSREDRDPLSRLGAPGCIAAPAARGAVAAQRKAAFVRSDLRLISIAGRDLAMAVENDRLRAEQQAAFGSA